MNEGVAGRSIIKKLLIAVTVKYQYSNAHKTRDVRINQEITNAKTRTKIYKLDRAQQG